MVKKLLQVSVGIFTFIAFVNVASASSMVSYQPEVPEWLRGVDN